MNVDTVRLTREEDPPGPDEAEERCQSLAERLLALSRSDAARWDEEVARLGVGLGLTALFGAALGLRVGGAAILVHAAGASLGLLAVAAVAVPAFSIVLALANAPIDMPTLARATSRAVAKAGLALGGLAPAAAMYVVTVEDAITVSIVGFGGLALAGGIAISSFSKELRAAHAAAEARTQIALTFATPAFLIFATTLAVRVWWLALPVLTGAR